MRRPALAGSRKGKLPLPPVLRSSPTQSDRSAAGGRQSEAIPSSELRVPSWRGSRSASRRTRGLAAWWWLRKTSYGKSASTSAHINSRNCSGVRPASPAMEAMVKALMGLWRGMVRRTRPFDITVCLPSRAMRKPSLVKTRTAAA